MSLNSVLNGYINYLSAFSYVLKVIIFFYAHESSDRFDGNIIEANQADADLHKEREFCTLSPQHHNNGRGFVHRVKARGARTGNPAITLP